MQAVFTSKNNGFSRLCERKFTQNYTTSRAVRWKTQSAGCGVRSVESAECEKCGVWKVRSVEIAECGKLRCSDDCQLNVYMFVSVYCLHKDVDESSTC